MDLQEIKLFLRTDNDDEDMLIQSLVLAAENYLTNAGCKQLYNVELYRLAIMLLVSHFYENRDVVSDKKTNVTAFGLPQIITQLKYCYEVI